MKRRTGKGKGSLTTPFPYPAEERALAAHDLFHLASCAQRDAMTLIRIGRNLLDEKKAGRAVGQLGRYVDQYDCNTLVYGLKQVGYVLSELDPGNEFKRAKARVKREKAASSAALDREIVELYMQAPPEHQAIILKRAMEMAGEDEAKKVHGRGGNVVAGPWGGEARS